MNFLRENMVLETIGEHHDGVIGQGTTDQGLHVFTLSEKKE